MALGLTVIRLPSAMACVHTVRGAAAVTCLLLVIAMSACAAGAQDGTEALIRGLRFPTAYDVRTHERQEYSTFTVSFSVHSPYPSDAVLRFYDQELQRLGWMPFAEPSYQQDYRRWDCFEDLTEPGTPLVHQLGAKWTNKEKRRMVVLVLRYSSANVRRTGASCPPPDTDVQRVDVQLMPFVALPR